MRIGQKIGLSIVGALALGATYLIVFEHGEHRGKRLKCDEVAINLADVRYDAQQSAEYAGNLIEQEEFLRTAEAASRALEILSRGHLSELSPYAREQAFPPEARK